MTRTSYIVFTFLLSIIPFSSVHGESLNAGFVEGIWYSSETVFADVPIRIYVAFRNNTGDDLSATVRFTDNEKRIGSSEVHALSGRLVEAWVDWIPTYGSHTITVTLTNVMVHPIGSSTRTVDVQNTVMSDTLVVDHDTDRDGVSNTADTDDDADGVSDTEEIARGSDPLVPNPIPEKESEKVKDTQNKDAVENTSPDDSPREMDQRIGSRKGLEQYVGDGMTGNLLTNVTEKVDRTKQSLDTYREERNHTLYTDDTIESPPAETHVSSGQPTITRTKIETKNTFLSAFIDGVSQIFKNIWTFVLFALSQALSHPALIQLLILVGILYIFYRLIRRVGRRPID